MGDLYHLFRPLCRLGDGSPLSIIPAFDAGLSSFV